MRGFLETALFFVIGPVLVLGLLMWGTQTGNEQEVAGALIFAAGVFCGWFFTGEHRAAKAHQEAINPKR